MVLLPSSSPKTFELVYYQFFHENKKKTSSYVEVLGFKMFFFYFSIFGTFYR